MPALPPGCDGQVIMSDHRNLSIIPERPLTKRERQVLHLMAEGLSTKVIATQLQVAFKTASCHRSRILTKLGVRSTVAAVRWAIREGLIEP